MATADAFALVVGIARYTRLPPLPTSVARDAADVAAVLTRPDRGGLRPDAVRLLLDADATADAVRHALRDLARRATHGDRVIVYFSCHGARPPSRDHGGGEYLLTVDTTGVDAESLRSSAISGPEFADLLAAVDARLVLVLLDCCHAGGIGVLKTGTAEPVEAGLSGDYLDRIARARGRAVIASCRPDEASYVVPGAVNSLFTRHLLDGLDGGAAGEDGLVRIFNLFEYVQPRVTADQPHQHPVFRASIEENVALVRGGSPRSPEADGPRFRYDAYVSFADVEPDRTFVWDVLLPRLRAAGLAAVVSTDVERLGVARVVNTSRGIESARRTVVVLSPHYLRDPSAAFENELAQTLSIDGRTPRLLPVRTVDLGGALPARLRMLAMLDLSPGPRQGAALDRLVAELRSPLPRTGRG